MQLNYKEQLADSRWLQKKAEILIRDNYTCQKCGAKSHLNVHHLSYEKGKLAWEYPNEKLITLCKNCHEDLHREQNAEILNGINRGDWYQYCFGEFTSYAIIFDIDYTTKTIYLFGSNEGSWGSAWIYQVKYKDFVKKWQLIDIFAEEINDDAFAYSNYFLGGFTESFNELMSGRVSIYGVEDDFAIMYAQHFLPIYIQRNDVFINYCDISGIKYDY